MQPKHLVHTTEIIYRIVIYGNTGAFLKHSSQGANALGTEFGNNTLVTQFNELYYFDGVTLSADSFYRCTNLEEIDVRNVNSLNARYCFSFVNKVNYFWFQKLEKIGKNTNDGNASTITFRYCTAKGIRFDSLKLLPRLVGYGFSVEYVIMTMEMPPEIGTQIFFKRIYVPDAHLETYKTYTSVWEQYSSIIFPLSQFKTDFPEETYWDDKW